VIIFRMILIEQEKNKSYITEGFKKWEEEMEGEN
jgi:hypothetical protein